jgi:pimeloyl-ACP methyl ester carboxylesterase
MKPALILLPGLGADGASWQHQLEHLSDAAELTVLDLWACASRADMAEHVLRTAPERFALAGQSMGGWVAQDVAARAPERVTKLALLNTWARPDPALNEVQRDGVRRMKAGEFEPVVREHLPRILPAPALEDAALVGTLTAMAQRAGPEVVARQLQAMIDAYDSRACLPKVQCPTLVIAGREDMLFSLDEHKYITAQISGARLAIIENCGHVAALERPQAVTALLRYWLTYF